MHSTRDGLPRPLPLDLSLGTALAALALACGGGSGASGGGTSGDPLGSLQPHGDGTSYVVEANAGGQASRLRLARALWGRLVDVHDRDPASGVETLRLREMVVGQDVQSDGVDLRVERNPATGLERVVVLHAFGTPGWDAAFARLEVGLQSLAAAGGIVPMVPRNAAVVLVFDDLIEADTVREETLRLLTGEPPDPATAVPFEARVLPSRTHGDRRGGVFHPTRAVIDLTVSELERQLAQQQGQSLVVNTVGLPAASSAAMPNVALRIPTVADLAVGQFTVLRNPSGHALDTTGNGAVDPTSPTVDVVRTFRSGSGRLAQPDPFNGFLRDTDAPRVLGAQAVTVNGPVQTLPGGELELDLRFATAACVQAPAPGDVLELAGAVLEVSAAAAPPPPGGVDVVDVRARLLAGDAAAVVPGTARLLTAYDPAAGDPAPCFVGFSLTPSQPPTRGVSPSAGPVLRFSEPMDPGAFEALATFAVERPSGVAPELRRNVVGGVVSSATLDEWRFVPSLPLEHVAGGLETYVLRLDGAALTDLAGNALANALPAVTFELDPNAAPADTFDVGLRLDTDDQDGDGLTEIRGQFLLDPANGGIRPRAVSRFSSVADTHQPAVGFMTPFTQSMVTPVSNHGSRMQTVWRHIDLGLGLTDEPTFNLDVEGLAWAPFGGQVTIDDFDAFQMLLGHSRRLPDELLDATAQPVYPNSGLTTTFAGNYLDTPVVVHDPSRGYSIDPLGAFVASSARTLYPWPMNRGLPMSQWKRFTWRDTRVTAVGGPNGNGADPDAFFAALGQMIPASKTWPTNAVPSVGLPLLMEFRCYADGSAFGLNGLQVAFANTTSFRPNFRAFSTGGVNSAGQIVQVDPDTAATATGGFAPGSTPPGQPTPPADNTFYFGQVDFVVRVSVVHTAWFGSGSSSGQTQWMPPIVEPRPEDQPPGTSLALAFRGADSISPAALDAAQLDPYGDVAGVIFTNADPTWHADPQDLTGARNLQVRITFLANAQSLQAPRLAGLGLAARR